MHTGVNITVIIIVMILIIIQDTAQQVLNVFRGKSVTCHGNVAGALLVEIAMAVMAVAAMAVAAMAVVAVTRYTGHIGAVANVLTVTATMSIDVTLVATTATANTPYQGSSRRVQVFHRQLL